ncbi:ATP-grasp domain-containing protein [Streptomyces sp. NPDC048279]|uniref:ATP-grasp domain-containing protein n=1 Tax=Streptomyces sp. NPDC048279 TaxID=3154714 RepID=UPI003439CAA5
MDSRDALILLIDPTDSESGRGYRNAVRDLGFKALSVFTGLSPAADRQADPADPMSLRVNDVDDAVQTIRTAGYDVRAVVPTNGSSLHVGDEIAARLGLPGNEPSLGWARRNKAAMRARATEMGVRVPEYQLVSSLDDAAEAARAIGFPVIVKQTMGTGSLGVVVVSSEADLTKLDRAWTDLFGAPVTEWLVERYVRGREYAVNFCSAGGVHRLIDIWEYRWPDDRDYDFPLWDIVQIDSNHPDYGPVERFCQTVLNAFGLREGPGHIEVKCETESDDVYLIELASRFSGGPAVPMWSRHSDLRPFHDAVECYLGRRPNVIDGDHGFRAVLGSVVVRNNDASGTLVAVHGLDELRALPGVADVLVEFQPGDHVPITDHNMCIPVSASVHGPDRAAVLRTIAAARAAVKLEIFPDSVDATSPVFTPGPIAERDEQTSARTQPSEHTS